MFDVIMVISIGGKFVYFNNIIMQKMHASKHQMKINMFIFFRGASPLEQSRTCPNQSGVGAIDNLDRFEQVFDQYDIPEAPENFFQV